MTEKALTLKEAAGLLGVSYGIVYLHKLEMGFFQVGHQWRVCPDTLRESLRKQTERKNSRSEPSKLAPKIKSRQTSKTCVPKSAAQAKREFDEVVAQIRSKRRR